MTNLYKPFFLLLFGAFIFCADARGQNVSADLVDAYIGDSIDWVDTEVLDYEDFKEIAGFGDLHSDDCEEPSVDINIGYYQRLFDVKLNLYEELNCKRCQTEAMYEMVYEFLRKGLSFDYIKKKLSQQDFVKLVSSDDSKLFSIQWNQGGSNHTHYILIHQVTDGVYHIQNKRLYYSDDFDNKNSSCLIDKIQRIKETGRYVVYVADLEEKNVRLFGVNICDNVLKKEYMFSDKASYLDIKLGDMFADRNRLIYLDGLELIYPVFENGSVCDGYLFYNGFSFIDIESYNKEIEAIEAKNTNKVGRKYRILSESSDWIDEAYSKTGLDFVLDYYTNFKDKKDDVLKCCFYRSDLCPQLNEQNCELDSVSLYLPVHNGRISVDGISSIILKEQLLSHYNPTKKTTPQIIYTAGHDEAFAYEKVKYTTVLFDKEIKQKDAEKVLWAVVVDNSVQYLDKKKYRGMQILLEMSPKWEGRVIRVVPYIGKIDMHFYCETDVVSR